MGVVLKTNISWQGEEQRFLLEVPQSFIKELLRASTPKNTPIYMNCKEGFFSPEKKIAGKKKKKHKLVALTSCSWWNGIPLGPPMELYEGPI